MDEFLRNFGVDWKLLLVQAVNFFVVVIIVKKFVYLPVLKVLRQRKEQIEKGLKFSREAEEKLKQSGTERARIIEEAQKESLGIISRAEEIGKLRGAEIVSEASEKAQNTMENAKRFAEEEEAKMAEEVRGRAAELVKSGIAAVLRRLPAEARNRDLMEEALAELKTLKK